MASFKFVMISAGFEHGGNVMHRHLDGHSRLLVYPFESQLGNRYFYDFLASVERVQYRYPEFAEGLSARELYEEFYDEELKTFLRKRSGSKFRDVDLRLKEANRIENFIRILGEPPFSRRRVIEAFFRSTFEAWENCHIRPTEDMTYVGYSPAIGIDSDRIISDFANVRIIHVIRNPLSAYRDTKRRPFPLPLRRYLISWNIYHSTVDMYARLYPSNVKIVRYEDFVAAKKPFMEKLADFMGVRFEESMLYPSWNGVEIKDEIAPWGTVLSSSPEHNAQVILELDDKERNRVVCGTMALARYFGYQDIDYLTEYYRAK